MRRRSRPSPRTLAAVLGLLAALAFVTLALAPRAEAYIYWTNGTSIGRADLDGTGVNPMFIAGAGNPVRLALDAEHVYWTNRGADWISRANLDGTGVDKSFIGVFSPTGVAVDAEHLYWTWSECDAACTGAEWRAAAGGIGRANLDGTGVDQSFIGGIIPAGFFPFAGSGYVAVDAQHVYWIGTFCEGEAACKGDDTDRPAWAIGRANLDGTGVDRSFIVTGQTVTRPAPGGSGTLTYSTGVAPTGLAVDGEHIYWTGSSSDPCCGATLGRASLDGTGVDQSFIDGGCCFYAPSWTGLAVDDAHLYWADLRRGPPTRSIRRANLGGGGLTYFIVPGGDKDFTPGGGSLAVDARTSTKAEGKASAARTQRQSGKKVVVKVRAKAKEPLTAKARGKVKVNPTYKLKPEKVKLDAGETKMLRLKPGKKATRKLARALKRGEKAKAKLTVKLTDPAGNRETERLRVRLKR